MRLLVLITVREKRENRGLWSLGMKVKWHVGFLSLRGCRLGLGKRGRWSGRIDRVSGPVCMKVSNGGASGGYFGS